MEKQKIFWVVLSVSVFVVVVLVVGVFLLKQKPYSGLAPAPGTVSPLSDLGTQVYEYQRETTTPRPAAPPGAAPSSGTPPENTQTMHFYIGEGGDKSAGPETQPATTPPPAAAQPPAPQKPAIAQPAVPKQVTPPAQAARPVVKAVPRQAPIKPPAAQTRTARRTVDYWIQTGSYKSQTKAEELATLLSGKGLSARLFSYVSRNETYYRVRIGPYGNKGEADKFLSIVQQIQGLESSYLSMVGSTKYLN